MGFIAQLPPLLIGLEACGSAHYWARRFRAHGHEVKLIAPPFVRPYVKSNKNDTVEAEAICEAVTRPTMRFVPIKTVEQQDWQAVHRVRERLVTARTALVNEIRGLLAEYRIVLPKGITRFRAHVVESCERHTEQLSPLGQELFQGLSEEFVALDERIGYYDKKIVLLCNAHPSCRRLQAIPGFGALAATALVAAVGEAKRFQNGRQLAAWVGVVPQQHSTGGKSRLLGISKRGGWLSAQALDPRGTRGAADEWGQNRSHQSMGATVGHAPRAQSGDGGFGQQECAHCLGPVMYCAPLPGPSGITGGEATRAERHAARKRICAGC
jgi:transposase